MEGVGSGPGFEAGNFRVSPGSAFRTPPPSPPVRQHRGENQGHGVGVHGEGDGGAASRPRQHRGGSLRVAGNRTPPLGALPPTPGDVGEADSKEEDGRSNSSSAFPDRQGQGRGRGQGQGRGQEQRQRRWGGKEDKMGSGGDELIRPLGVRHPRLARVREGGEVKTARSLVMGDNEVPPPYGTAAPGGGGDESANGHGRNLAGRGSDLGAPGRHSTLSGSEQQQHEGRPSASSASSSSREQALDRDGHRSTGTERRTMKSFVPLFGTSFPQGGALDPLGAQASPPRQHPHHSPGAAVYRPGLSTPRTTPRKPGGGGTPRIPSVQRTPRGGGFARSEASMATSMGDVGCTGLTITQGTALLHWQTHHGNSDRAKWPDVFEGLAADYPSAMATLDGPAIALLRSELTRDGDAFYVSMLLFENFTVVGGLPQALQSLKGRADARASSLKRIDAAEQEHGNVVDQVARAYSGGGKGRGAVAAVEAVVGGQDGASERGGWGRGFYVGSRRKLEKIIREGFGAGAGDVTVQAEWREGIVSVGEDCGVVRRLLLCDVELGATQVASGSVVVHHSKVFPRYLVTLGKGWNAAAPPPPPPRAPPVQQDVPQTPQGEKDADALVRHLVDALRRGGVPLESSTSHADTPSAGQSAWLRGGIEKVRSMLRHRQVAVKGAALDLLLEWASRDASSRETIASAVSLEAILGAARPGLVAHEVEGGNNGADEVEDQGGMEGKAALLAAALSECGGLECGDESLVALRNLALEGGVWLESCLRASASLSLRDDLQPGLVKCGLADVARDAAASNQIKFEKSLGTDNMDAGASLDGRNGLQVDRGGGVRQHALCFLSRVIHLVADDRGWVTEGLISAAVASLEFGGDAEKVGAASVVCGIGVRDVGRGLLLRAGALSAAVHTASGSRGNGADVEEGAVEVIAVLCLDPSAASKAVSCGALDLMINTLGGREPHGAIHLRCLEAMSSMCLHTSVRDDIARRGDAKTALVSMLSSPSSALRKRAAYVLASLPRS